MLLSEKELEVYCNNISTNTNIKTLTYKVGSDTIITKKGCKTKNCGHKSNCHFKCI